ncbi:MAG TPA: multiheme c-type cytochrome [Gemmataceae bacterium]|nr:multiheme c-type cytochrome [Gemmataceae bacterium]
MARFYIAVAFGTTLAIGLAWAAPPTEPPRPVPVTALDYKLPTARFYGQLSCSAASCHASGDPKRPGGEYTTWTELDPHSRAYEVLFDDRSRRMVQLLRGNQPGKPQPAHESGLCLNCHAPEAVAPTLAVGDKAAPGGVGCESCHGPAERWLASHFRPEFRSLSRREKAERHGLYPTKDLAFRTMLCAACHVGDANREVNHDLVAAGHPRLAFEYTGYHHSPTYGRHWEEKAYGPDFDARAWEVGQTAAARAASDLLAFRAQRSGGTWPELSEYSCFACHKDLSSAPWKPLVTSSTRPGALPWGSWYFSTADLATGDATLRADIDRIVGLMERAGPNRRQIATEAAALARKCDARLRDLQAAADDSKDRPYSAVKLRDRFNATAAHALAADGQKFAVADWDGVGQHYLGAASLYYAWAAVDAGGRDPRPREPLVAIGRGLRFPRPPGGASYDSPKGADPTRLLDLFRRLPLDQPKP